MPVAGFRRRLGADAGRPGGRDEYDGMGALGEAGGRVGAHRRRAGRGCAADPPGDSAAAGGVGAAGVRVCVGEADAGAGEAVVGGGSAEERVRAAGMDRLTGGG